MYRASGSLAGSCHVKSRLPLPLHQHATLVISILWRPLTMSWFSHPTQTSLVLAATSTAGGVLTAAAEDDDKQEPEILDGPRKRKVRFDFTNAVDDAELDELLPPAGAKSATSRGRGRGRRGRPPKTPGGPAGVGAYEVVGFVGQGYQNPGLPGQPVAYPGNILPGPDAQMALQQQQMYAMWGQVPQQQQQQVQDQLQDR